MPYLEKLHKCQTPLYAVDTLTGSSWQCDDCQKVWIKVRETAGGWPVWERKDDLDALKARMATEQARVKSAVWWKRALAWMQRWNSERSSHP